jgi:hypothetical protein
MLVAVLALFVALSGSAYAVQRLQSGDSLIAQRSLSGNRLRLATVTGKEVADLTWHDLTLINDWYNWQSTNRAPGWAIDAEGIVHLRGDISQNPDNVLQFARLPKAARPNAEIFLAASMEGGFSSGSIVIKADGTMSAFGSFNMTDSRTITSLDGLTYSLT